MNSNRFKFALGTILVIAASTSSAATVYSQDFEGAVGPEWSGGGAVQTSGGLSAFGFGNNHWRNDGASTTGLTLTGLASHTSLTLSFNLAMWDSIDIGNDRFIVTIDGAPVYDSLDFGNYFPADNVGHGPGANITASFTDFATPQYGYNTGFRDSARFASFTVAHSDGSVVVGWQYFNSQGGLDESFGVDNVVIDTNHVPVPEPASYALMALGLAGLGIATRRQRARGL